MRRVDRSRRSMVFLGSRHRPPLVGRHCSSCQGGRPRRVTSPMIERGRKPGSRFRSLDTTIERILAEEISSDISFQFGRCHSAVGTGW